MVNKAYRQPVNWTGCNFHYWLLLSLFLSFFMSAAMAQHSGFKKNPSMQNSSTASITQPKNAPTQKISIEELLTRFARNGSSQLFDGTFVYLFEDAIQTIKVKREKNEHGDIVEKFIPLDSNQQQSSRSLNNQYCLLDNGWQFQFQAVSSSFPFRINNYYQELQKNYDFNLSEIKIIAGTPAIGLFIKAKDPYRYGYELWFEPETATLLKYKLIDQKEKVIEQYLFTDIGFHKKSENFTMPANESEQASSCLEEFRGIMSVFNNHFSHNKIPRGYEPVSFRTGIINNGGRQAYQFQLSDGIASVSIFIEERQTAGPSVNGVVKLGPVNVAGKTIGDYQITVLGAIPVASALHFLNAAKDPGK
ncbi:MAG: hypothetical protein DRQ43_08625 [Gammaproteobacteria bacterium]|nr:MAG: hypothetical protein DRQ43_08625 [Gammaproteobacteria bacterium]